MEEKNITGDTDEIMVLERCGLKLHRVYTFQPYTHWRIKQILKQRYNAELIPIGGYKCSRVYNYRQSYRLVDCTTGRTIMEEVELDTLRRVFAKAGIPLHDENSL